MRDRSPERGAESVAARRVREVADGVGEGWLRATLAPREAARRYSGDVLVTERAPHPSGARHACVKRDAAF